MLFIRFSINCYHLNSEEAFGDCFYCVEARIQREINILELIHICHVGTDL